MSMSMAYVLTTLLPNLKDYLKLVTIGCIIIFLIVLFISFLFANNNEEIPESVITGLKTSFIAGIIFAAIAVFVPTTQQVALMLGLRVVTSEQAVHLYGETGQYMQNWLDTQLKSENK